ncbi:hypothetical protein ONO23_00112 [Micromonospora noduli]|uniref:Uncharacterized protein n=1 Tax=Micromonospora noduli TaxID=709876 RepID=A0ABX9D7S8_9ACTN|nr:hypothetical protein LUPAC07_03471 [Micromonospora noduli]RAO22617.1 hypothetical protein MED15_01466 [Micromonospora noduli]RAO41157.1 hypothetical protein ONO23_00112 [Micromonospora noduli]
MPPGWPRAIGQAGSGWAWLWGGLVRGGLVRGGLALGWPGSGAVTLSGCDGRASLAARIRARDRLGFHDVGVSERAGYRDFTEVEWIKLG